MPLESSKHKFVLYKSVKAVEFSIYRVLIYTFQMGDYRTVVKHSSITLYNVQASVHPSIQLFSSALMGIPPVLVV